MGPGPSVFVPQFSFNESALNLNYWILGCSVLWLYIIKAKQRKIAAVTCDQSARSLRGQDERGGKHGAEFFQL